MDEVVFRRAEAGDVSRLLSLQASYYAEDGYPHDEPIARAAWEGLLGDPALGRVFVAEAGTRLVAYVVLTLGYSLEYQGRDAFVDEVYVRPEWRGMGIGRRAFEIVDEACAELGVKALHLEVEADKEGARALYHRQGFAGRGRVLMTKLAPGGEGSRSD